MNLSLTSKKHSTYLVSDIGGTNSRFSIFSHKDGALELLDSKWFKTADYKSFQELLETVKGDSWFSQVSKVDAMVVAAAGPVDAYGECRPPNIKWPLSEKTIRNVFGVEKVKLVNDFLAQSYAILTRIADDSIEIKSSHVKNELGMIGVVGPGTGLGKAMLYVEKEKCIGLASEGGHATFSATNREEVLFLDFIKEALNASYVTEENVVCGKGVEHLYQYLYNEKVAIPEIALKLKKGELSLLSELYSRFLGRVCRDFALNAYAVNGIVLAGGVLAKTPELLNKSVFCEEFIHSDTQSALLKAMTVRFFANENSGLWGAAKIATQC